MLTGASIYGWAHLGMRRLLAAGFVPRRAGASWGAVAEWERWLRLSWIGLTVGLAGIAVGVAAALVAIRKRRSVARDDS